MKYKTILILLTSLLFEIAQSQCIPDLKMLYEFQNGDVFQYRTETNVWAGGEEPETHVTYEKRTVIEKNISVDTINYVFDCLHYSYYKAPSNAPYDRYGEISGSFSYNSIIIDSSTHYLNACDSELVYIDLENDFYSFLSINDQGGFTEKKVGGFENIFRYDSNDSLIHVNGFEYEQIFGEGIGLKSQEEFFFEHSKKIELQGYVKDGDSTGVIWDDQDFVVSIKEVNSSNQLFVYPSIIPEDGIINIDTDIDYNEIKLFSIDGKAQEIEIINQHQIITSIFHPGIYVLLIRSGDSLITYKLIKL